MNVVDSSGWIEYFVDGPNAAFFADPMSDASSLIVPTVSVLEVYRYVLRNRGRQNALDVAAAMHQGRVIDLDESLAIEAAELGTTHSLPLADSIIYATAAASEAELWTQDSHFKGLRGVRYAAKGGAL